MAKAKENVMLKDKVKEYEELFRQMALHKQ